MKRQIAAGFFWSLISVECIHAAAMFNLTPNTTSTYVRSDSTTSVEYSVSNRANDLTGVSIDPTYQTTGQASGLSITDDNCTGTLNHGCSCNFTVVISGENQPATFQVTPRICAFNGQVCSVATRDNNLEVAVDNVSNPTYAYFAVLPGSLTNANTIVPVNTATLQVGSPVAASLPSGNYVGISVSHDGSRVYVTEDGENPSDIAVLNNGGARLSTVSLDTQPELDQVVVTPAGDKIYTSNFGNGIYEIKNNAGSYTLGSFIAGFGEVEGLATSPDGKSLYVTDYGNGSLSVLNTQNNEIVATLNNQNSTCDFYAPEAVVVSPNNNRIYVGSHGGLISVIERSQGRYHCSRSINLGEQAQGMAMSPDGRYLYVIGLDSSSLYVIATVTRHIIAQYHIPGVAFGVAITPDGGRLFISNADANTANEDYGYAYVFNLVNGLPVGNSIAINVGGQQESQGNFAG